MKNNTSKLFSTIAIMLFMVSTGFSVEKGKPLALVAKDLSVKIESELSSQNVSVKFTKVAEKKISNNEIVLTGDAVAVLPSENTELPIHFEAKVNPVKEVVDNVEYVYVESSYAPTAPEEFLTKNLLKQISTDYKTENVVIAIDGFEMENAANNQKKYKGVAEVKVNEVQWKKIDFTVIVNDQNDATEITYAVK